MDDKIITYMQYIGRFAPSPSGSLHFGSLVAALGSFLQAKFHQGKWLVRIENIDPPREVKGAADEILRTLDAYGLHWDDDVLYQSSRLQVYQNQIDAWLSSNQAYYCQCTRQQIKEMGGIYDSRCRNKTLNSAKCAVRICLDDPIAEFFDKRRGIVKLNKQISSEDFIIKRRDGLFAYNLAVVMDDIYQGVTEIVRGEDLLAMTGRQLALYQKLGAPCCTYLHLPLALNADGNKLSKQNHAPALDNKSVSQNLTQALQFLGCSLPKILHHACAREILEWAIAHWNIEKLSKQSTEICRFENEQP